MSEEKIINVLGNLYFDEYEWFLKGYDEQTREQDLEIVEKAIQGLLDLYNKEKEKYERLKAKIDIMSQCSSDLEVDLCLMDLKDFIKKEEE